MCIFIILDNVMALASQPWRTLNLAHFSLCEHMMLKVRNHITELRCQEYIVIVHSEIHVDLNE